MAARLKRTRRASNVQKSKRKSSKSKRPRKSKQKIPRKPASKRSGRKASRAPITAKDRAMYYAAQLQLLAREASGQSKVLVDYEREQADVMLVIRNPELGEIPNLLIDYVQPSKRYSAPWIQIAIGGKVTAIGAKHGRDVDRPLEYQRGHTKTIQSHATRFPGLAAEYLEAVEENVSDLIDANELRIRLHWNEDNERPEEMV